MVILFDGVCNMCNGLVHFVIKRDKKNIFQFASLQSSYGKALIEHFNLNGKGLDTVLVYDGKKVLTRSDATLAIVTSLKGIWVTFVVFRIMPRFIRNSIYNFMAKRRYAFFGKRDNCMVPTDDIKNRFLDETQFSTTL
jgi:predicted DCC family thiol-disulfide oxidoreductase YuxK